MHPTMSSTVLKELEDFREKIKIDAEELVSKRFPEHMLDLDKLLLVRLI